MFASFQKKYFLSDKGVAGVKRGIFWTALTNLITMAGMGLLFLVMAGFVEHLATGADLPDALPIVGGLLVFFVLLFASNWQQYYYTYCIFYEECGKQRMEIAERLRKLPLSFLGRRDLADLTETIMGDVQAMEHAYSHVLGELWGAIIASAIVFVASLFFCWQLAIAAFWSVPVAFAVLYLARGPMTPVFDRVRAEKVKVTEAIQETLDCVREIRATNQEAHYLEGLNAVCKSAKLSKEQGAAVLKYMQGNYNTATAALQAQRQEMTSKWLEEARADKEFGGDKFDANLADARKALAQFDTGGDIGKMLNETGYGNHPAILRIFARVGKALGEDNLHGKGGGEAAEKPLAERFYPNM